MLFDFCKSKRNSAGPSHSNVEVACLPVPLNVKAAAAVAVDDATVLVGAVVGAAGCLMAGVFVATKGVGIVALGEVPDDKPGATLV